MAKSRRPAKKSRSRARPVSKARRGGKSKSKSRKARGSRGKRANSRSKSKSKVKVSPATYNKKKCAVTPGWEWVPGKGCRKVKGATAQADGAAAPTPKSKSSPKSRSGRRGKKDAKSPSTYSKAKCQVTPGWQWVQGVGCRKVRDYSRPAGKKKTEHADEGDNGGGKDEEEGDEEGDEDEKEERKDKAAACPKLSPSSFNEATCKVTPGWQWIEGVGCRKIRNYKGSPNAAIIGKPAPTAAAPEVASALQDTAKALQSMMPAIQKLTSATTKPATACVGGVCPM